MCAWLFLLHLTLATSSALDAVDFARENGFTAEKHRVLTEDGYLLSVHRILPAEGLKAQAPVVFLQHGVLASSLDWVIAGPESGLGYRLASAGFDVWMGNLRGNTYSRDHIRLSPEDRDFWDFSWHEIGLFDIPAMVDHVLATTGHSSLSFVGHSMGATVVLVTLSQRPQYNNRMHAVVLLAPVTQLKHSSSIFRHTANMWSAFKGMSDFGHIWSFPPSSDRVHKRLSPVCESRILGHRICAGFLHAVAGYTGNLNSSLLPALFAHYPTQTSIKTMCHFMQGMSSGKFRQFDHGRTENERLYNSSDPPEYPLGDVTSSTAIFYGDSDPFTEPQDLEWLSDHLVGNMGSFKIASESFSHLSFLWANDVSLVLHQPLLALLNRFRRFSTST